MNTTEQEMVIIDGVGMPLWMYVAVKDRAVWTNETQFVGVRYHAPAHLAFDRLDPQELFHQKVSARELACTLDSLVKDIKPPVAFQLELFPNKQKAARRKHVTDNEHMGKDTRRILRG